MTLNALAVIAVLENPDLKAQRAKAGVTDAQTFSARLLPDPTFTGNFDNGLFGPDPFNGFGGSIGFDVNQLRTAKVIRPFSLSSACRKSRPNAAAAPNSPRSPICNCAPCSRL